ncbi:hypothetical protein ACIRVF_30380 [Kitasatospora sp. NPDC101157]|uniref:hypothetical protein n=1 Tax=Kitasatospora sp. NPDC101157 TaxID=3364098 RepID=UPI00382E6A33
MSFDRRSWLFAKRSRPMLGFCHLVLTGGGESVAVAALAYGDAAMSVFESDFVDAGERRRLPLGPGWNRRFETADPVHEFRVAKGTKASRARSSRRGGRLRGQ